MDSPHLLKRIEAIQLTIEVIIHHDDRRTLVQLVKARLPVSIKIDVAANRFKLFSDKVLINQVILDDENNWLLVEFHI